MAVSGRNLQFGWRSAVALLTCLGTTLVSAASGSALEAQSRALERARDAVVGVKVQVVEGARTERILGSRREGSGVLIGADGLVLTIGYLILEAQSVELSLDDGRRVPARVVAQDAATGLGLVQALAPLGREPVPLGTSAGITNEEPMSVASGGANAAVSVARLLSRRAFTASWEYHLDAALYTTPPRRDHSGAGLFSARGELLGIGSLWLADVSESEQEGVPGNMFVPVDLIKPVLDEMRQRGRSLVSARAWLGLNCSQVGGVVQVQRVTDDSPADVAGLEAGDRIVYIDGVKVTSVARLWQTLWAGSASEREVVLEIERAGRPRTVRVNTVDREYTLVRASGV